ncbi:MAG: ABC transporter permease [Gammaproteobacteria bacterium]
MLRHIANRVVLMTVTLIGVATITFFLSRVLPGSPVALMVGYHPTQEAIDAAVRELGLDRPLSEQYVRFVTDAVRGDFGMSLHTKQPVIEDIAERSTATIELTTLAVVLVMLVGVPIGVISAVRSNTLVDHVVRTVSIAGVALPVFMAALLLQMCFYGWLGWLPLQGRLSSEVLLDSHFERVTGLFLVDTLLAGDGAAFKDAALHLLLPVTTLTLATLPMVTRITRNMMMEVLNEEYVRTAFAYGIAKRDVYYRYALRATLIPLLTVVGLTYGFLLGGSVVVEFVFDWPGLGGYVVRSITRNDFPAAVGVTLVLATAYLTINLVVDLLYHVIDPRLRPS